MTAPEPLRLFVAVPVPDTVRAHAAAVTAALRGAGEVRWVAPDRIHLTLKFLGDTAPDRVPAIEEKLAEKANGFSRFVVESGRLGAFPDLRRPRTIWLAVQGAEVGRLTTLAGAIDAALHELGIPKETSSYRPHLTLGRVRSSRGLADLTQALAEAERNEGECPAWEIGEFHLVRSLLRPAGPEYTILRRFLLGANAAERDETQR